MSSSLMHSRKGLWDTSAPIPSSSTVDLLEPESETKRILRTANEIKSTGSATLTELDAQGRKIKKAQDGIASINDRMNVADRAIYEIGSFWGSLVSRFRSDPPKTEYAERQAEWEVEHAQHMEQYRAKSSPSAKSHVPTSPPLPACATEDEQFDRDLDDIHRAVLEIREMANEMNVTLHEHNRRLDHLGPETDLATGRIRHARGGVQKLIDKA